MKDLFKNIYNKIKGSIKIIAVLIVAILIVSSVYVVFYLDDEDNNPANTSSDTIPPTIDSITGNTTGSTGKITSISVTFSDNEEVTLAMIFYKSANDETWIAESVLSGRLDVEIPPDSDDDWYYYVTIDDEAGNGPVGDPSTDGSVYFTITVTETVEELVHTVFIEEATGETCEFCPGVSEVIHELYNSGEYNFEYVSLVVQHDKAKKRLDEDLNNFGQPTLYIDSGFKVLLGGGRTKADVDISKITDAIRTAEQRSVPEIKVTVDVDYENDSNEFTTNVIVKNFEEKAYNGTLRVYLAEILSRYKIQGKTQIYHGFVDYIIDKDIIVVAGEELPISEKWDLTTDLDPENLMVIAVVFSSESEQRYSNPDTDIESIKNPFNAYFADATDSITLIEGGNLPPKVGILNPSLGKIHLFGRPLFKAPLTWIGIKTTRLFGRTNIVVNASDDDGSIEKVEFYIDGELVLTDEEAPYEYQLKKIGLFKSILFRKHLIKVIAYDDTGKTSTAELEVKARL